MSSKMVNLILFLLVLQADKALLGQSNYSLLFDGQDDYIEIPFADNHDLFGDFSIEGWLKFDSIPSGRILSKVGWLDPGDSVSSYSIYFDETEPYKLIFSTWIGQSPNIEHKAISSVQVTPGEWHYFTVTYSESSYNKKIYIDGVLTFNEDNTGDIGYNGRPLFIGAFKSSLGNIFSPYEGNIDEVRIWGKTLSQTEVLFNMHNPITGNEIDLMGLWHFNEGTGDTVFDSSIYNVNGSVTGAIWDIGFLTLVDEAKPCTINFSMLQNYPNPFNPSTTIQFSIPEDVQNVKLIIYSAFGEKVAELVNTGLPAGIYKYSWNASDVSSGMYIYQVATEKFVSTRKMILMK